MDLADFDLAPETLFLLWAARETGALDALLRDADTPAEVAATAGIDEAAADLVVSSLASEGFLERVDDAYEPTNRLLGFLAAADLRSVGELPAALDLVDALSDLPAVLETGAVPGEAPTRDRLGARAATDDATVRAVASAVVRQAPDADSVLDVRGAPGHYARAIAALGSSVTLADAPAAVERPKSLLATTEVDTVTIARDESLPTADLAFAGDVLRRLPPDEARGFVGRLAKAAASGGTVVVVDYLRDRSEGAVPAAVRAFARDGATVHPESAVRGWFADAGLADVAVRPVPGTDRFVVAGRSPR